MEGQSGFQSQNVTVSIIVAVYNAEKYLEQCLESIEKQTYKNIEIICVNDGSTDSSLEILEKHAKSDERIKIYSKENEGLGGASARNYGLDRATGKYISILDSDDFFDQKMIEKAVLEAEKTNADIVLFGGCEYDDQNGNTYPVGSILDRGAVPKKNLFSYKDCPDSIFQISQGMAWNKLFRKEFLDSTALRFQRIKYTDDAYFTFGNMVLAKKIHVIKENLCFYRVNTGLSQTDGLSDYPDSAFEPYLELKKSMVEWGIYNEVQKSFMNCAASFIRYFYDKISKFNSFKYLHDRLRNDVIKNLDMDTASEEDFRDFRVYLWVHQVLELSAEEIIFKAARSYGSEQTTSVLRFQFPYENVPKNCKLVIMGAGIMGRNYYSQLMLSGYCDVVEWVEWENPFKLSYIHGYESLRKADYDYVLIAYAQSHLVKRAVNYLNSINVPQEKIIYSMGVIK